jgi:hypothetical protein
MIGGACRSTSHRVLRQSGDLLNRQLKGSDQTTIGEPSMTVANDLAVRRALEAAGVIFVDENGDAGPGVRLRKRQGKSE